MSQPRIVVIGSSNTDLVLTLPRLPRPGESIPEGAYARHAGGKGANQAVAAARAGAEVTFIGARGEDDFGRAAAGGLEAEGIDIRHFHVIPGTNSGTALIFIGADDGQNMIGVARSANDHLRASHVHAASGAFTRAQAALAQLETPFEAVMAAALEAERAGIPFLLNPAPVPAHPVPKPLWKCVHTATPNEHEIIELTGAASLDAGAARLLEWGCRHVVVTLGARGARLYHRDAAPEPIPAAPAQAVDTVGAGDCFSGWLAVGLASGLDLAAAASQAVEAASISVTRPGAQASMPRRDEVLDRGATDA